VVGILDWQIKQRSELGLDLLFRNLFFLFFGLWNFCICKILFISMAMYQISKLVAFQDGQVILSFLLQLPYLCTSMLILWESTFGSSLEPVHERLKRSWSRYLLGNGMALYPTFQFVRKYIFEHLRQHLIYHDSCVYILFGRLADVTILHGCLAWNLSSWWCDEESSS
jgi:hypothetical protein